MTPKQKRFVGEYLQDLNAKQAAIRSGYSAKTAEWIGPQLLKKTHVSAAVADGMKALAEKSLWTREDSVRRLIANIDDPDAKVSDKNAAVKILNEMHGYDAPQKIELTGKDGKPVQVAPTLEIGLYTLTDDELMAIAAGGR